MTDITVDELARRLDDVVVVDVRTNHEFAGSLGNACDPRQGHIPGARNLDVHRLQNLRAEQIATELGLEPGAEVVVYCHSGSRSSFAALRSFAPRATRLATTSARGTSGRGATSCRSRLD